MDIPFNIDTFTTMSPLARGGADLPMLFRVVVGLLGAVLLFRGAKTYMPALMLTAFTVGSMTSITSVWIIVGLLGLPLDQLMILLVGLAGGTGTCFMAWAMHRMALMTIGVTVGAVFGNALFAVLYANPPFWAPMAGGAIGLVAFPILFPFFLKVFTSAAGSVVVAWALGYPTNLIAVGGLWGLGMTAQFMFGPPSEGSGGSIAVEEPAKKADDGFRRSYRM